MPNYPRRLVRLVPQANWLAWMVLVVVFAVTWWGVHELHEREKHLAWERFERQVEEVVATIRSRMTAHEQILIGGAALFDASDEVSRDEWHYYVERLGLHQNTPGIQAMAYAQVVYPEELAAHIQSLRTEFPDYDLHPAGDRPLYTPIIYIEPFRERNLAAFGFDMYSETVRRQAMMAAVDENDTRISGRVTLVQENRGSVQPGFLMYLPVYKKGMPLATPAERWQALRGFIHSPYRLDDLMEGILGHRNPNLHFAIFAEPSYEEAQLLFNAGWYEGHPAQSFNVQRQLPLYGQVWTLEFSSDPGSFPSYWQRLEQVAVILGMSTGLLLFLLIALLTNENQRARSMAKSMTREMRHTLEALRLSEERFRLALDSSSMGTWNWYLAENQIHWDNSIYPLFGLRDGQTLGSYESFLALLHPDDRERVFREIARAMEGQIQYDTEYRVIWPDGSLHHIASRARVLLDGDQQPLLMTGTCWDITDKKHIEKMKDEFVATVSHELRTPLTSIAGAVALLNGGGDHLEAGQRYQLLDIAEKNTAKLRRLIDDLLDMEKLSQSRMHFAFQSCALVPLVMRAVEENRLYAEQYKVGLRTDISVAVAEIRVDPGRFLQVMTNLLSNAVKFSPAGTEVVISLVGGEPGWVRVAVTDQGIGIAEADQARIFDKFYQVDASDSRKKGGTGLGLAITRLMVEQMQGRLGVHSALGQGSSFFVDFPLVPGDKSTNSATRFPGSSVPNLPPIHG